MNNNIAATVRLCSNKEFSSQPKTSRSYGNVIAGVLLSLLRVLLAKAINRGFVI